MKEKKIKKKRQKENIKKRYKNNIQNSKTEERYKREI